MQFEEQNPPAHSHSECSAYESAIADISENAEVLVNKLVLFVSNVVADPRLTLLKEQNDFLSSELNTGEGYIRKKHA